MSTLPQKSLIFSTSRRRRLSACRVKTLCHWHWTRLERIVPAIVDGSNAWRIQTTTFVRVALRWHAAPPSPRFLCDRQNDLRRLRLHVARGLVLHVVYLPSRLVYQNLWTAPAPPTEKETS